MNLPPGTLIEVAAGSEVEAGPARMEAPCHLEALNETWVVNAAAAVHPDAGNPYSVPCESNADEGKFALKVV